MFEFKKQITKTRKKQDEESQVVIEPESVVSSQIEVQSLICCICHQIFWKPLMCSIPQGCHTYFCTNCIQSWIDNQMSKDQTQKSTKSKKPTCPQCKHTLTLSSSPPLLKSLLSYLKIKCIFNSNGCQEILGYSSIQKHASSECSFRNVTCEGCGKLVIWKDYQKHTDKCDLFIVQCSECVREMTKKHYINSHVQKDTGEGKTNNSGSVRSVQCYSYAIANYHTSISAIQTKTTHLTQRLSSLQTLTSHLIKNTPIHLPLTFQTGFTQHFHFSPNSLASTLIKPSFNLQKNRNDFLHFYIQSPIQLNSLLPIEWILCLTRMKGNILLGFCSSIGGESVDLVVNKYGEVKKKEIKENRYKLVKRIEGFGIQEKDAVVFLYDGRNKILKITNQTRNLTIQLGKQCIELFLHGNQVKSSSKQAIYAFYSMDTPGDKITFINEK